MARTRRIQDDFDWLLALPEPLALRYHNTMTRFEEEKEMPHLSTAEKIGLEKGRRALLLDQLSVKFGPLSAEIVARVNALESSEIDRLGRAILTAQTLQELDL